MKKILIIDDNRSILEVVEIVLSQAGYLVQTSTVGSVVDNFNGNLPDLILLDVLLVGENGLDICRKLKNNDKTKAIPVIIISAHYTGEEVFSNCQADDYQSKPFDVADLIKRVNKYLA